MTARSRSGLPAVFGALDRECHILHCIEGSTTAPSAELIDKYLIHNEKCHVAYAWTQRDLGRIGLSEISHLLAEFESRPLRHFHAPCVADAWYGPEMHSNPTRALA